MARAHNFYAGPAVLPEPALQAGVEALRDYKGIGMSVIEISHRSKEFTEIIETTEADIRELMNIPDNYHVLFMTGGASTQFALIPMTFLKRKADYVDTGAWSAKAIKEAVRFGEVHLAGSGKEGGYTRIPDSLDLSPDADYVHVTSNNT
ncbi:MAG: 3-phosphoserine/phosphohydroxythreonine aminotransferase, partial [Planctomycetota bacterium]